MVCLGNICRSPLAEGILKEKIAKNNLDWTVDSAGTGAYHVGELPDPRSIAIARQNGIDITDQRAQKIRLKDLEDYDLILTMDSSNYQNVLRLTSDKVLHAKVKPIMDFVPSSSLKDVPDPYWDDNGFQQVFDMLDKATEAIVNHYGIYHT